MQISDQVTKLAKNEHKIKIKKKTISSKMNHLYGRSKMQMSWMTISMACLGKRDNFSELNSTKVWSAQLSIKKKGGQQQQQKKSNWNQ